jgi:hypothetical protein
MNGVNMSLRAAAYKSNILLEMFSENSLYWMIQYIHHSDMEAPHYVYLAASSDDRYHWMTYYTHHTYLETHHHVQASLIQCSLIPEKQSTKWGNIPITKFTDLVHNLNLQLNDNYFPA